MLPSEDEPQLNFWIRSFMIELGVFFDDANPKLLDLQSLSTPAAEDDEDDGDRLPPPSEPVPAPIECLASRLAG